jgi:hypothetical protein
MTPNTTIKSPDKIKLLDQMLEDLAGDEFDEYNEAETDIESELMRHAVNGNYSSIDNIR